MKRQNLHRKQVVHFRRFSRKGYAVFASLGKQIKIARLAVSISQNDIRKGILTGSIANLSFHWEEVEGASESEFDEVSLINRAGDPIFQFLFETLLINKSTLEAPASGYTVYKQFGKSPWMYLRHLWRLFF